MLEGSFDRLLRDLVEHHAIDLGRSRTGLGLLLLRRLRAGFGLVAVSVFFCRLGGDRVGHDLGVLARFAQDLGQVSANCFAFAVRVTRQIDGFGVYGCPLKIPDDLQLRRDDLVGRLEYVFRRDNDRLHRLLFSGFALAFALGLALGLLFSVLFAGQKDTDGLLRQVHHMAVGSLHVVVPAEILIDRLGLSRRLHDYKGSCHPSLCSLWNDFA